MRQQFFEQKTHCVNCTRLVPPERLKFKAITCSPECARLRKLAGRAQQDSRECRHCRKPATLGERAAYRRFRLWESKNPAEAYPAEYKRWSSTIEGTFTGKAVFTITIARQMAEETEEANERAKLQAHVEMGPVEEEGSEVPDSEVERASL